MTYFVTAYTNDKAELIVSESRTTDWDLVGVMVAFLMKRGYIVKVRRES